jgi:ribosomal protein S18 acetylase RimI-like enzyme
METTHPPHENQNGRESLQQSASPRIGKHDDSSSLVALTDFNNQQTDDPISRLKRWPFHFWPHWNDPPVTSCSRAAELLNDLVQVAPELLHSSLQDGREDIDFDSAIECWIVLARLLLEPPNLLWQESGSLERSLHSLRLAYADVRHAGARWQPANKTTTRTIPFRPDPFWPQTHHSPPLMPNVYESSGWTSRPFRTDDLPNPSSIHFGDEPWCRGAVSWLFGDPKKADSAAACTMATARYPCSIQLFHIHEEFMGFASLQRTTWQTSRGSYPLLVIPWLGIDSRYRGSQAPGDQQRLSDKLLEELIAVANHLQIPLALFVAEGNYRAKRVYSRNGFQPLGPPRYDRFDASFRERWIKTDHLPNP